MQKINSVCIIDDDSIIHFMLNKTIQLSNYVTDVLDFYNGAEALSFLIENANNTYLLPDIIFLDINMPVMNGWEFMNQYMNIKYSLHKSIVIYITTSSSNTKDLENAKEITDIREYIVKPLSVQKLNSIFEVCEL